MSEKNFNSDVFIFLFHLSIVIFPLPSTLICRMEKLFVFLNHLFSISSETGLKKKEINSLIIILNQPLIYHIFQLLDEMLDNGFPLTTESNILKELIKPPNILRTIANTVTGKTKLVELDC